MGCGASKGKEESSSNTTKKGEEINVEFKYCHVYELDQFFREVKSLYESIKTVT